MKKIVLPIIIFLSLFTIAILIFKDYGIPWDEPHQQKIGEVNFEYIVRKNPELHTFGDRYYGSSFEILLIFAQKIAKNIFNLKDENQVYQLRHILTFSIFFISLIFFYLINKIIFKNNLLAIVSILFLILSPRIFAHSFFNSKDIPLLSFFIISFYFLLKFEKSKSWKNIIFFSIFTATTISIRLFGLFIPIIFILSQIKKFNKKNTKYYLLYFLITTLLVYIFWPILWQNPIQNFINAIRKMSHYPWDGNILFMGKTYPATNLPFYYMPIWFLITTPPIYLLFFIISFFNKKKPHYFYLSLGFFIIPIISVILSKSTLYDGWRHLFFIYPFFIIISTYGFKSVLNKNKRIAYSIIILSLMFTSKFMLTSHPHQHVYFNFLAGKNIKENYELDYWGLSFKKGLEFLLNYEGNKTIKVTTSNWSGGINAMILPKTQKDRFEFYSPEDINKANYFITNFRWHPQEYEEYSNKIYSEKVNGTEILAIYKI